MLNETSLKATAPSLSPHFIQPLYGSYCFSELPGFIKKLFNPKESCQLPEAVFGPLPRSYEKVVLLVLDAFGWCFFERYKERFPFLKRFLDEGSVSKLTSQFPSTTACHMTSIHTGLPVSKSGVFEWFYYEPQVDAVIAPLLFSFAGDKKRNTLLKKGYLPENFFPSQTLYKELPVPSHVFQHEEYTPSPFSKVVFQGSSVHPYKTLSGALTSLGESVKTTSKKAYFFLYLSSFDSVCHHHGPDSPEAEAEITTLLTALENEFFQPYSEALGGTLFMVTADHGQIPIHPTKTHYLNLELPGFERYCQTNRKGEPIILGGSPRDLFLYIKKECLAEVKELLTNHFKGLAEVYKTEELIQKNLFGSTTPSEALTSRLGNLVILPYKGESVWWYEKGRFENKFYGHHGGLTPEEAEIPLLLMAL